MYLIDTEFGPGEDCICGEYMSRGQSISICLDVVLCGGSHVSSVAVPAEKVSQDPIYRKTGLTSSHGSSDSLPKCLSKWCNTCDVRYETHSTNIRFVIFSAYLENAFLCRKEVPLQSVRCTIL